MEQNGNSAKEEEQSQHLQDALRSTLRRLLYFSVVKAIAWVVFIVFLETIMLVGAQRSTPDYTPVVLMIIGVVAYYVFVFVNISFAKEGNRKSVVCLIVSLVISSILILAGSVFALQESATVILLVGAALLGVNLFLILKLSNIINLYKIR